jgi:hypothetical protein
MFFRKAMKLNCQRFLLLFFLLHTVFAQEEGKAISTSFKQSIDKFIEKIAVLKKNMKKLAAEREKVNSKNKLSESDDSNEYDSEEYEVKRDDFNDEDDSFDFDDENKLFDLDDDYDIDLGIDDDIDYETENELDLSQEVDDIEDSLKSESSFLDKLLSKLSKKDDEKHEKKSKLEDLISRTKNRDFLTGLKERSQRARTEQTRLSGFLNSQVNLDRPRFRQDPLSNFRDILGVPPPGNFRSSRFRDDPFDLVEENRSLFQKAERNSHREEERQSSFLGSRSPSSHVNKAFQLLDGLPQARANDGNVFVFTFADSNNPVLVFDG